MTNGRHRSFQRGLGISCGDCKRDTLQDQERLSMASPSDRTSFLREVPSWNAVFHHYRKWCKKEEWQKIYSVTLSRDKNKLDQSILHIDGSPTPVYSGIEKAVYQGRKKRCTTNALFFLDNQGIPLTMSEPQAGSHADLYEI